MKKTGALQGVKILDFTQAYSGPFCAMQLSDYGAEVIKMERFGSGDQTREWGPFLDGKSGFFATFNRGKKSISVNLREEAGKEVIRRLVREVDVVLENFKPGTLEKMGLGYETMREINPAIIYGSISGYGINGPWSRLPAYDNVITAQCGIMNYTGSPDGMPIKVGPSIGDNYTGLNLCYGICLALYHRAMTGEGQRLDVAMMDSLFTLMDSNVMRYAVKGETTSRTGQEDEFFAPCGIFEAKDGFFSLAVTTEKEWRAFCAAIGRENWAEPYADNVGRLACYKQELAPYLYDFFRSHTKQELQTMFDNYAVAAFPVENIPSIVESDYIKDAEMAVWVKDPNLGDMLTFGVPLKFSDTPGQVGDCAPDLGQYNEKIFTGLGYSGEEIQQMREAGIISR